MFLNFFMFFIYIQLHLFVNNDIKFFHMTDIGPVRPVGFPRYRRRTRDGDGPDAIMMLENVRENLESLTSVIPTTRIKDMPERYQRQVVGVPGAWI